MMSNPAECYTGGAKTHGLAEKGRNLTGLGQQSLRLEITASSSLATFPIRRFAANSPCICCVSRLNLKKLYALQGQEDGAELKTKADPSLRRPRTTDVRKKKRPAAVREDKFFFGPVMARLKAPDEAKSRSLGCACLRRQARDDKFR